MVTAMAGGSLDGPTGTSPVPLAAPSCSGALSQGVASGINEALRSVLKDGTAAAVGPPSSWPWKDLMESAQRGLPPEPLP